MRVNRFEPEEFLKKKRLILLNLGILLVIQIIVLCAYVFKEHQSVLSVPMILGIIINAYSMVNVYSLGK